MIFVIEDIKSLMKFKIPVRDFGGLAGLVQGLGLLLVLSVALTGFLWFSLTMNLPNSSLANFIKEIHEFLGNIVWIYLAGHVGMYIIHLIFDKK